MYEAYFEVLATWASDPRFKTEITEARKVFFGATGTLYDDDDCFDQRMAAFSEYYLFDFPLENEPCGRTPARLYLFEKGEIISSAERCIFRSFTQTIHGLFQVKKCKGDLLLLRDLLTMENHRVDSPEPAGLKKKDIVETRLIPWNDRLLMGRTFTYHPGEAGKIILSCCKQMRRMEEMNDPAIRREVVWILAKAAIQYQRQKKMSRIPPRLELTYGQTVANVSLVCSGSSKRTK